MLNLADVVRPLYCDIASSHGQVMLSPLAELAQDLVMARLHYLNDHPEHATDSVLHSAASAAYDLRQLRKWDAAGNVPAAGDVLRHIQQCLAEDYPAHTPAYAADGRAMLVHHN